MASKEAPCTYCGTVYSLRRLRCPKCHLDREDRPAPVSAKDRLAGLVMIGLAVVMSFGIGLFVFRTLFIRHAVFLLLPAWLLLHGSLLLMGVHFRDFRSWWYGLAQPARLGLQLLGIVAFAALVWLLATAGRWR
ncbi:MAG: hypothetical protein L0Y71_24700 [Gemmataceae bacterium]|nr:hypothetical protein [Gemmataceae bacterium]